MNKVNYKNLYSLPVEELDNLNNKIKKSFVFQGSKNWDLYFEKTLLNNEISEFKDVLLIDFSKKNEFEKYIKENNVIDYSMEHFKELGKYFVLVNNNG